MSRHVYSFLCIFQTYIFFQTCIFQTCILIFMYLLLIWLGHILVAACGVFQFVIQFLSEVFYDACKSLSNISAWRQRKDRCFFFKSREAPLQQTVLKIFESLEPQAIYFTYLIIFSIIVYNFFLLYLFQLTFCCFFLIQLSKVTLHLQLLRNSGPAPRLRVLHSPSSSLLSLSYPAICTPAHRSPKWF